MTKKIITVIPARMGSSRFPGKPMKPMLGMPMIGHCWHRARLASGDEHLYVATCDVEIAQYVESIGGKAVMTSSKHDRASDRTAEAVELLERDLGITFTHVMMIQGDEPIVTPEVIRLARDASTDESDVVNIMSLITREESFRDYNNVKVVTRPDGRALYFSREPIPSPWKGFEAVTAYMQTGIMMFTRAALSSFQSFEETKLEQIESVDLNRFLENGFRCQMVAMNSESLGIDTPEELVIGESLLLSDPSTQDYLEL